MSAGQAGSSSGTACTSSGRRTRIFATDDANGYNTGLGSPGKLVAPSKAGSYEIRFVEEETVDHIKARLPLTVR